MSTRLHKEGTFFAIKTRIGIQFSTRDVEDRPYRNPPTPIYDEEEFEDDDEEEEFDEEEFEDD